MVASRILVIKLHLLATMVIYIYIYIKQTKLVDKYNDTKGHGPKECTAKISVNKTLFFIIILFKNILK